MTRLIYTCRQQCRAVALVAFMLGSKQERHTSITKKLILPDIEPEDLSIPRTMTSWRKVPKRPVEMKEETVEVNL